MRIPNQTITIYSNLLRFFESINKSSIDVPIHTNIAIPKLIRPNSPGIIQIHLLVDS